MQEVYIPAEVKQSICLFWSSTLRNIGDDVSLENSLGQSIQNHLLEAIQVGLSLIYNEEFTRCFL